MGKYPAKKDMWMYWYQNKDALLNFIDAVHMGIKGIVVDDLGNLLPNVKVTAEDIHGKNDPPLYCHAVYTTYAGDYFSFCLRASTKLPMSYLVTKQSRRKYQLKLEVPKLWILSSWKNQTWSRLYQ